jgi:hypothetical protein
MFAHLAQKQAVEVLELNLRLLDAYEQTDIRFQEVISKPIAESQTALHKESLGTFVEHFITFRLIKNKFNDKKSKIMLH